MNWLVLGLSDCIRDCLVVPRHDCCLVLFVLLKGLLETVPLGAWDVLVAEEGLVGLLVLLDEHVGLVELVFEHLDLSELHILS